MANFDRKNTIFKMISAFMAVMFSFTLLITPTPIYAQMAFQLPIPGTMIKTTPGFHPPKILGLKIDVINPLKFNFIIDTGDEALLEEEIKEHSDKLIKYFMASLTVPEEELWVNLSPYEDDRIIPSAFGLTEMGRDLLAQDYMLKQLTASLMYPEEDLGQEFWDRVYTQAMDRFGTTDIPMNTFNKIWIVPEKAAVYEHEESSTAYVLESSLKVMLEEDYVALQKNLDNEKFGMENLLQSETEVVTGITSQVVREVLIPEIEREVNQGKTFANLRQIYDAMILATWYKNNLHQSLLGQVYMDQNKVSGIELENKNVKHEIYEQYVEAFKKGVYDYIKEDYDPVTQQIIPRKYFSGGFATFNADQKPLSQFLVEFKSENLTASNNAMIAARVARKQTGKIFEVDAAMVEVSQRLFSNGVAFGALKRLVNEKEVPSFLAELGDLSADEQVVFGPASVKERVIDAFPSFSEAISAPSRSDAAMTTGAEVWIQSGSFSNNEHHSIERDRVSFVIRTDHSKVSVEEYQTKIQRLIDTGQVFDAVAEVVEFTALSSETGLPLIGGNLSNEHTPFGVFMTKFRLELRSKRGEDRREFVANMKDELLKVLHQTNMDVNFIWMERKDENLLSQINKGLDVSRPFLPQRVFELSWRQIVGDLDGWVETRQARMIQDGESRKIVGKILNSLIVLRHVIPIEEPEARRRVREKIERVLYSVNVGSFRSAIVNIIAVSDILHVREVQIASKKSEKREPLKLEGFSGEVFVKPGPIADTKFLRLLMPEIKKEFEGFWKNSSDRKYNFFRDISFFRMLGTFRLYFRVKKVKKGNEEKLAVVILGIGLKDTFSNYAGEQQKSRLASDVRDYLRAEVKVPFYDREGLIEVYDYGDELRGVSSLILPPKKDGAMTTQLPENDAAMIARAEAHARVIRSLGGLPSDVPEVGIRKVDDRLVKVKRIQLPHVITISDLHSDPHVLKIVFKRIKEKIKREKDKQIKTGAEPIPIELHFNGDIFDRDLTFWRGDATEGELRRHWKGIQESYRIIQELADLSESMEYPGFTFVPKFGDHDLIFMHKVLSGKEKAPKEYRALALEIVKFMISNFTFQARDSWGRTHTHLLRAEPWSKSADVVSFLRNYEEFLSYAEYYQARLKGRLEEDSNFTYEDYKGDFLVDFVNFHENAWEVTHRVRREKSWLQYVTRDRLVDGRIVVRGYPKQSTIVKDIEQLYRLDLIDDHGRVNRDLFEALRGSDDPMLVGEFGKGEAERYYNMLKNALVYIDGPIFEVENIRDERVQNLLNKMDTTGINFGHTHTRFPLNIRNRLLGTATDDGARGYYELHPTFGLRYHNLDDPDQSGPIVLLNKKQIIEDEIEQIQLMYGLKSAAMSVVSVGLIVGDLDIYDSSDYRSLQEDLDALRGLAAADQEADVVRLDDFSTPEAAEILVKLYAFSKRKNVRLRFGALRELEAIHEILEVAQENRREAKNQKLARMARAMLDDEYRSLLSKLNRELTEAKIAIDLETKPADSEVAQEQRLWRDQQEFAYRYNTASRKWPESPVEVVDGVFVVPPLQLNMSRIGDDILSQLEEDERLALDTALTEYRNIVRSSFRGGQWANIINAYMNVRLVIPTFARALQAKIDSELDRFFDAYKEANTDRFLGEDYMSKQIEASKNEQAARLFVYDEEQKLAREQEKEDREWAQLLAEEAAEEREKARLAAEEEQKAAKAAAKQKQKQRVHAKVGDFEVYLSKKDRNRFVSAKKAKKLYPEIEKKVATFINSGKRIEKYDFVGGNYKLVLRRYDEGKKDSPKGKILIVVFETQDKVKHYPKDVDERVIAFAHTDFDADTMEPLIVDQPASLANAAMNTVQPQVVSKDPVGGIDLNPEMLDLQIKRDGRGIPLPIHQQPLGNMQIEGFLPVIINITPVQSLPMLLGLAEEDVDDPINVSYNPSLDPFKEHDSLI